MTSSQQKTTSLTGERATASPSIETLGGLRLCRWAPWAAVLAAQDTIGHAAARILVSHSLLGASDYGTPNDVGSPDSASQRYPRNHWRTVAQHRVRVMPGSILEARGWYIPAGQTQRSDDGGVSWVDDGKRAQVRLTVTWDANGTVDGPHRYVRSMEGSPLENGRAPTPAPAFVRDLDPITFIWPASFFGDPDVIERYSEWPEVYITIETSGAPRVGDLTVFERFVAHVDDVLDGEGSTLHGYQIGAELPEQPQTTGPRTQAAGANEPRFGTQRLLEVAERQRNRVGPHILSWSAWEPDAGTEMSGLEHVLTRSSTTFGDIFDGSITSWSINNPGWHVEGGAYAADWGLSATDFTRTGRSVIPVRVEVYAFVTGTGPRTATVRMQSGYRDFVDVEVGSSLQRYVAFGWLEVQREGDSVSALMQAFVRTDSILDTLQIADIDVWFGHF